MSGMHSYGYAEALGNESATTLHVFSSNQVAGNCYPHVAIVGFRGDRPTQANGHLTELLWKLKTLEGASDLTLGLDSIEILH